MLPLLPIVVFVVATVASIAAGALVRRVAPALGAVVPPRVDRWHDRPTPTMGGVAIVAATFAAFAVALTRVDVRDAAEVWVPVPLAALAMFVVGLADDRIQLGPLAKLVSSLIVGAFLVFALGRSPLGGLPLIDTLLAIVWFAGVCHALNLLDNMDGLATGVALIATAFGLFAAIPAVYFYNHFTQQVKQFATEMDDFSLEFLNISERNFT